MYKQEVQEQNTPFKVFVIVAIFPEAHEFNIQDRRKIFGRKNWNCAVFQLMVSYAKQNYNTRDTSMTQYQITVISSALAMEII